MSDLRDACESFLPEESVLAEVYPISAAGEPELSPEDEAPRHRGNGRRARPAAEPSLRRVLEAILFATDHPVTVEQLLFAVPQADPQAVEAELQEMRRSYAESGAGFIVHQTAGGYLLQTDPELHEYVHRFLVGKRRSRLSRAAMETLAIIAYRQPITRGEAEEVRGVDCGQVLHTLLERNLVTIRGRSQALGRPLLYGTTAEFLHYFGISSLADLPSLDELRSLMGGDPLQDPEIRQALEAEGLIDEAEVVDSMAGEDAAGEDAAREEAAAEDAAMGDAGALPAAH